MTTEQAAHILCWLKDPAGSDIAYPPEQVHKAINMALDLIGDYNDLSDLLDETLEKLTALVKRLEALTDG